MDLTVGSVETEEGYDGPATNDRTVVVALHGEHAHDGDAGQQR